MQDFTTDTTAAIYAYADDQGLVPEFVKKASVISGEDTRSLPDMAFADPVNRLYPCHTKEATVMSAIYVQANMEDSHSIWSTVEKRAAAFDCTDEVNAIRKHFETIYDNAMSKKASEEEVPMQKFALTIKKDDEEHNYYDISTREDTLVSMSDVDRDFEAGAVELPWMRKLATAIMDAAVEFGVEDNASSMLKKYAQVRLPDLQTAKSLISARTNDKDSYEFIMNKLASNLLDSESFEQAMEAADEAASLIYTLDKRAGVEYNDIQLNPYDIIFSGPTREDFEKFASSHVYISDVAVPVEDIVNVSDTRIQQTFSKNASAVITDAINPLRSGDITSDITHECHEKIASLDPAVRLKLLEVLANTGF